MKVLGIGSVFTLYGEEYVVRKITKSNLICDKNRGFPFEEINLAYDIGDLIVKSI